MVLSFYKYQGTGNDFVMIDDRSASFDLTNHKLIASLCDRRFGIGGDGLIVLRNHESPEYDFEMVYYNADGYQTSMCGNGGRCIVRFAEHLGIFTEKTTFIAIDGPHEAYLKDNWVYLKMINVVEIKQEASSFFLDTGSPHHIQFVDNVDEFNVFTEGKTIRYSDTYATQGGTNVNFVEINDNSIKVRTYERGVEDETLSCGTGVTAASIAASFKGVTTPVKVKTLGGELGVTFNKTTSGFNEVFLAGPAERVFTGEITI